MPFKMDMPWMWGKYYKCNKNKNKNKKNYNINTNINNINNNIETLFTYVFVLCLCDRSSGGPLERGDYVCKNMYTCDT